MESRLDHREHVLMAMAGSLRPPLTRRSLLGQLERFLGAVRTNVRVVVLTTSRLLVLPARPKPDDWFDVQLDRRALRASAPRVQGDLVVVELTTGLGPRVLLADRRDLDDATRLARLLGASGA